MGFAFCCGTNRPLVYSTWCRRIRRIKLSDRKNELEVVPPNADGFAHLSRKWPCHDRMTMSGFCHFLIRKDNKGCTYVCNGDVPLDGVVFSRLV